MGGWLGGFIYLLGKTLWVLGRGEGDVIGEERRGMGEGIGCVWFLRWGICWCGVV